MVTPANTADHLVNDVILAAAEYNQAENALSDAWRKTNDENRCHLEIREAKRRAAQVAIAIDGLTDRAAKELGISKKQVRNQVAGMCKIDGTPRVGCHDRVRAVANAYKHYDLNDQSLPIFSNNDVLVAGLGYGLDGYGVGKSSGVEVLVKEKSGTQFKFLGDVPWSIAGWFHYLGSHGVIFPEPDYHACGLRVGP